MRIRGSKETKITTKSESVTTVIIDTVNEQSIIRRNKTSRKKYKLRKQGMM